MLPVSKMRRLLKDASNGHRTGEGSLSSPSSFLDQALWLVMAVRSLWILSYLFLAARLQKGVNLSAASLRNTQGEARSSSAGLHTGCLHTR